MAASLAAVPGALVAARANAAIFDGAEQRPGPQRPRPERPTSPRGQPPPPGVDEWARFAAQLAVFRDLRRHFIFEYYPWYQSAPVRHWDEGSRKPPNDLAGFAFPALGAYDSRDAKAIEQHARWIADAGVGAINLSWWGQGSVEDRTVPLIMDVMRAHDIRVAFHIEPYSDSRGNRLADDVAYLIREYGEKRRWDAFLLLEDARGVARPVFKTFKTIISPTSIDCHGRVSPTSDYTDDSAWRRQTDAARTALRDVFNPLLLADSLGPQHVGDSGFDGMAIYDPLYRPSRWPAVAAEFSAARLLFSFNVNPGFDKYPDRPPFPDCFSPAPFEPPIAASGWGRDARDEALTASRERILESLRTTLALQLDPALNNRARGFFILYINSFNEWHEGTAFEPAADFAALSPEQRAIGYHNPDNGRWRLQLLQDLLAQLMHP